MTGSELRSNFKAGSRLSTYSEGYLTSPDSLFSTGFDLGILLCFALPSFVPFCEVRRGEERMEGKENDLSRFGIFSFHFFSLCLAIALPTLFSCCC